MPDQNTELPPQQPQVEDGARASVEADWAAAYESARASLGEGPPGPPEPVSRGFWRKLGENVSSLFARGPAGGLGPSVSAQAALGRGVTKAADEVFEFVTEDVAAPLLNTPLRALAAGLSGDYAGAGIAAQGDGMAFKHLVFSEEERQIFETWYDQRNHVETAIFGNEWREKNLPYLHDTLAVRMVETVTQFSVGFMLTGGASTAGSWVARLGINAAKGAIVDFSFFDPHEQRLADVARAFGIEGTLIDYLAADEDDPNLLGRAKNAFEGIIPGVGVDLLSEGLRALRVITRGRSGRITGEEALSEMEAIGRRVDEINARAPEGPAKVVVGEDGTPHIAIDTRQPNPDVVEVAVPRSGGRPGLNMRTEGEMTLKSVPFGQRDWRVSASKSEVRGIGKEYYQALAEEVERRGGKLWSDLPYNRSQDAENFWLRRVAEGKATFFEDTHTYRYEAGGEAPGIVPTRSIEDAEMQVAAINAAIERSNRPTGDALREVKQWQQITDRLSQTDNIQELLARQSELAGSLPLGHLRDTADMVASTKALEDMLPSHFTGRGGKPYTEEEVLRDVVEMFGDPSLTVSKIRQWAAETFGDTENLTPKMVGFRQVLMGHQHNMKQTARSLARAPHDAWLAGRLAEQWEALVDLADNVAGTASNVGRAQQSQQIPVGTLAGVPKGYEPHARALAEFKSARRLYDEAVAAGQTDAARAALYRLDQLGDQLGTLVGGKGRPKNKSGLTQMFDRDARRAARAESEAAQAELPIEGLPPKPDVKQDVPGALEWHERAVRQIEGEMSEARAASQLEVPEINPSEAYKGFKGMSKEDIIALSRVLMANDDADIDVLMRVIQHAQRMTKRPKAPGGAAIRHFYISMLLSNPLTHTRNILSNLAMSQAQGIERIWAGAAPRRWIGRSKYTAMEQKRLRQEGYDFLRFYWSAFSDAWKAGKEAWRLGENVMDPGAMRGDLTKLPTIGEEISVPAAIFRPSNINRFMMAADEVAQQMTYRAHTKMNAMRSARESSLSPQATQDLLERVERIAFNEKGQATLPDGIAVSRDVTFKTPLNTDTKLGQAFQTMSEIPIMRATVLPFVRTPVNLWNRTLEHIPFAAQISKRFRDDIAAGGARAELARARTEIGGAVMATAGILYMTGHITGGGPEDPELREQWRRLGNKPYAFRLPTTDTWIRYDRFDPIITPIAFMADLMGAAQGLIEDGHEQTVTDAAMTMFAVTADRLSDRAYWGRVTETMAALLSGNPAKIEQALTSTGLGYIPAVARGVSGDPLERQVWSVWDRIKQRVPGLDRTLEPKRNIVGHKVMRAPAWGLQQQNPFEVSFTIKDHDAWDRLMSIGDAFAMPPRYINAQYTDERLDLSNRGKWADERTPAAQRNQSPYDRWMELSGQILVDGQTMEDALIELANSEGFQRDLDEGLKRKAFEDAAVIVSRYQDLARVQMFTEFPALLEAYQQVAVLGIGERVGNRQTIDRMRKLLER